jgi:Xaa-Pro aminopeptidase
MIDRRGVFIGAGVAGAAAILGSSAAVSGYPAPTASAKATEPLPIPLNRARATKVMADHGLDGLIAIDERNVFYATNLWPLFSKMQRPHPTLAVIPRDPDRPVIAVAPATEIWTTARDTHQWPQMIVYTAPDGNERYEGYLAALEQSNQRGSAVAPPGVSLGYWPTREDAELSGYEKRLEANIRHYSANAAATWQTGLLRALAESGLIGETIGFDDPGAMAQINDFIDTPSDFRPAQNIFRKIRVVKSEFEVAQMRRAAQNNADAVYATASQIEIGARESDIERIFAVEAGKRGAQPIFVVLDTVGGLSRGEVTEGQPIMIDAVSHTDYYHGDFGRTIVVGEPTRELYRRSKAIGMAWSAVMEMLRPGVRYSQIRSVAMAAADRAGLGEFDFRVTPHSVGLQHTDEPMRFDRTYPSKDDLVLEQNMTITVDFPMVSPGWGSCHLEDLVLITGDGVEPLNEQGRNVIVV